MFRQPSFLATIHRFVNVEISSHDTHIPKLAPHKYFVTQPFSVYFLKHSRGVIVMWSAEWCIWNQACCRHSDLWLGSERKYQFSEQVCVYFLQCIAQVCKIFHSKKFSSTSLMINAGNIKYWYSIRNVSLVSLTIQF